MTEEDEWPGPGWLMKDLSEIKPSSFREMQKLERELGYGEFGDLEKKVPQANDPLYKYVKHNLLPKPRDPKTSVKFGSRLGDREENYRRPKPRGITWETDDKGLSLLQELPSGAVKGDMVQLKRELKEAARKEADLARSQMLPQSAHKVYAWRGLLEDRDTLSLKYSCQTTPTSSFLPDTSHRRLDIYQRPHREKSSLHINRSLNCWSVPHLGPNIYRDKYGMKIIPNLDPGAGLETRGRKTKDTEYHYCWPFVDNNTGDSISSYSKMQ